MKKLTTIIMLLFICIQLTPAHAALEFTVEPISSNDKPNMSSNDLPYVYTLNGIAYLWQGSATLAESIEYTPEIYDSFIDNRSYEYVWTGEYYIGRYKGLDNAPSQYREPPIYQPGLYPVKLYDSELNPIKQHIFQSYVYGIGYFNGEYYCQMGYSSGWVKSSDFETWERTDGSLPRKVGDVITMGGKVSLDGTTFNGVVHENMDSVVLGCNWGKWKFYLNATNHKSLMLTNDNIYFIHLICQQDVDLTNGFMTDKPYVYIYEAEDDLVVDLIYLRNSYRLTTPKQPVYDALEAQKSAPYVCVNNAILGFETPPVTESDRTLVPMRFLFEQLGADVTWDEATETATAKKANTTINFSIDNTTATVNGAEAVMDVPARLVGDKTMVPLRFLSEEMGYTVEWNEETRMATITIPE